MLRVFACVGAVLMRLARLSNAYWRPLHEIAGWKLPCVAAAFVDVVEMICVEFVALSNRKMSLVAPLPSLGTMLVEVDSYTTLLPSPLSAPLLLEPLPGTPVGDFEKQSATLVARLFRQIWPLMTTFAPPAPAPAPLPCV